MKMAEILLKYLLSVCLVVIHEAQEKGNVVFWDPQMAPFLLGSR